MDFVQIAKIDPATATLVGAAIGTAIGIFGAAVIRYLLDRRAERDRIRGIARLLELELRDAQTSLERLREEGTPVVRLPRLNCPAWEEHRDIFATELGNTELAALHYVFNWLDKPEKPAGKIQQLFRPSGVYMRIDELFLLTQTTALALSAVATVRTRGGKLIRQTGDKYAAAPSLHAPCKCGHVFGQHHWRTEKRRVRMHARHVKFIDRASECVECDCSYFKFADSSGMRSALRTMRFMDQAPSIYPPKEGDSPDPGEQVISETFVKTRGDGDLTRLVQLPRRA